MTDAERALWRRLRDHQMAGLHFRRQEAVGPYVVDFICRAAALVIELDGGQHVLTAPQDAERSRYLELQGLRVLRFWNNDVLSNPDGVVARIGEAVTPPP